MGLFLRKSQFPYELLVILVLGNIGHQFSSFCMTVYHFNPDGIPRPTTRLHLNMSEVAVPQKNNLSSFSLCLRFTITVYSPSGGTLFSYALSDYNDNFLSIRAEEDGVTWTYASIKLKLRVQLQPLWWYNVCATVSPSERSLYIDDSSISEKSPQTLLHTNGSLVIGQDQDSINGGFVDTQSFIGEITDLNIWISCLPDYEIDRWFKCQLINAVPLIEWDTTSWVIHNNSESLTSYEINSCQLNGGLRTPKLIIFPLKKLWEDALKFLQAHGLEFMVPQNSKQVSQVGFLLDHFKESCVAAYMTTSCVWLGIWSEGKKIINVNTNQSVSYSILNEKSKFLLNNAENHFHIVQDDQSNWQAEFLGTKHCFVGLQRSPGRPFMLIGTNMEECPIMKFVFATTKEGQIYFHSGYNMTIVAENGSWKLMERGGDVIALVKTKTIPFGQHKWRLEKDLCKIERLGNKSNYHELTLTSCEGFTCTDGTCISQNKRCNQVRDCKLGSDENNCHSAESVTDFLMFVHPPKPVYFYIQVKLTKVGPVSLLAMTLDVDFTLLMLWKDSRLQYRNLPADVPKTAVSTKENQVVWYPELTVENSPDTRSYSSKNIFIFKGGDGVVKGNDMIYSGLENYLGVKIRIKTAVYCYLELRRFPWDVHHCSVKILVNGISSNSIMYNGTSTVTYNRTRNLGSYVLQDYEMQITNLSDRFFLFLHLKQYPENQIWIVYIPTTFLMAIGYGTLFLPVDRFAERGGMSLTTLLVLISLYTDTASRLPETTYLKLMDVWFVFTIFFLSLIITVHLFTCKNEFPSRQLLRRTSALYKPRSRIRHSAARCLVLARYIFGAVFLLFSLAYVFIIFSE